MGVEYLVTSGREALKVDTQYFVEQLRNRWPKSKVHFISDPQANSVFQWRLVMEDGSSMLGDFSEQGIAFQVSGLSNITSFALWYRAIVPPSYKLFLFKSSLEHEPIELTVHTTTEDIIAGFNVPLDVGKYE